MRVIERIDKHLARPYRYRRWLLAVASTTSLALVVYCSVTGKPVQGEAVLLTLLGGGSITYGVGRVIERVKGVPADNEDI